MSKKPEAVRPPAGTKPPRKGAPKKAAPGAQNRMVTVVVVTAFISTALSAAGVLIFQKLTAPETASAPIAANATNYETLSYYDFPKMSVYLKRAGSRQVALANIRVSAEFNDPEPLQTTKIAQPRIVDAMQAFLRERTREELDGRQGTDMLRAAFLGIVNEAIVPHRANTVLFREILIQ